jgi:hypothetical protein
VQKHKRQVLEIILSLIAIIVAGSIFLKAIIDLDTNYDVGWYHLPFAARIWGIVTENQYISENLIEYRYDGFPLLAHFFQGFLWKITGRMQATNLVGYLSLIAYFVILRQCFQVPLYLSVIAIFTIPAVLTHASTSMVDLPGNVAVSMLMMMVYLLFKQSQLPRKQDLLIIVLSAAAAANIKPQLQPLVFLVYCLTATRLAWLYFKYTVKTKRKLWSTTFLAILASGLIFATPIKNVALYGNPFYPIKIEVAGIVLNHKLNPDTYSQGNRPQKWVQSILEINTPPWWTPDQWNGGNKKFLDRAGGFFGAYVVFNLLLLVGLTIGEQLHNRRLPTDKSHNATTALITVLLMSLVPANFPQSHELRYFMFWMITLVSLNLYLVSSWHQPKTRWIQPKYLGVVCLLFLVTVYVKISDYYIKPAFVNFDNYLQGAVKTELLEQMIPNDRTCMIARHGISDPNSIPFAQIQNAFYYSSYFHPEIKYPYSIKVAVDPRDCGDLKIIPPNLQDFL